MLKEQEEAIGIVAMMLCHKRSDTIIDDCIWMLAELLLMPKEEVKRCFDNYVSWF